ncbi:MAG: calcineurin-like phosphoesterase family protein [Bacteroidales bacterium]|nr:calcineurin-like phosphoesterase family protein [Bacteroidales bacterium]
MKHLFEFALLISLLTLTPACGKDKPAPDPGKSFDVSLVLPGFIELATGDDLTLDVKDGKAPLLSDFMQFKSHESNAIFQTSFREVTSSKAVVKTPKALTSGKWTLTLQRDSREKTIGTTTFNIVESSDFKPSAGTSIYGKVSCEGKGVPGVVVSDGVEVTTTNAEGYYEIKSAKKYKYVFISIPSGYEVPSAGILPKFSNKLVAAASSCERSDFQLKKAGNQDNHTMLFLGDIHLANRTNDKNQFRTFTRELASYVNSHSGEKIYAVTLGDMTWDLYWYSRNYCFNEYLSEYDGIINSLQIFHTIGNHDHDMNATGDWDTVQRYHTDMCPSFYSFNIGEVHYITIDDIQCTNNPASKTDGGGRSYKDLVVEDVMNWLAKDLSHVDKATPVVVAMHAPVYNRDGGNSLDNAGSFTALFSGYNVTFVSGHSHVLYTIDKSSSIREHNNGAICAAWWWAGKYNPTYNISTDGSPSGYRVMSVKGTQMESYFKATGRSEDYQFRAYDRNKINLELSMVPSNAREAFTKELALSVKYGNYADGSSANDVIINVWDWNKDWKIEVTENGKALNVKQQALMDPTFFLAYTIPHLNANTSATWHPAVTNHMFVVQASSASSTLEIKVTDDEGRVYTETMTRPREFNIESYK